METEPVRGRPTAWRHDRTTLMLWATSFAVLVLAVAVLIESAKELGFTAWIIDAAVLLAVWMAAVLLIGRSGETPEAEGVPRSHRGVDLPG